MGSALQFNNLSDMNRAFANVGQQVVNFARQAPGAIHYGLFGPERESATSFGTGRQADLAERFARDNLYLGEQELRLARERAQQGRYGAAAGWGAMGILPLSGLFTRAPRVIGAF
jgi:hypothetical protein